MRKFLAWALGALVVLAAVGLVGVGWYYSGEILNVERPSPADRDIEVLDVDRVAGTVTLPATPDTRMKGVWGLDAPEAYARMGEVTDSANDTVTRDLLPVDGELRPGDMVDVDGYAYPQDAEDAFDFPVTDVQIAGSPLGDFPAWFAEGTDDARWAILVHGRAARRNECFRLLEILREDHKFNVLCPTYRNDQGAPADPEDMYRQGDEEWQDIEPAVQYALDQGATEVIVGGFSMGGQITANFLRHSDLADEVDAVVWDAPLLDWGPVIGAGAQDRGVPEWLVPIGMQASEFRAAVDYEDLNQIDHAQEFDVPILLIHGTKDSTVPVSVADRFVNAQPKNVDYLRLPGAEHVRAWNTSPRVYEEAVNTFIREHFSRVRVGRAPDRSCRPPRTSCHPGSA